MAIYSFILIGTLALFVLVVSLPILFIAAEFHERSHWVVARIWTTEVEIERKRGILAHTVNFHKPFDLPLYGVRIAGFAPVIFGLITATTIYISMPYLINYIIGPPIFLSLDWSQEIQWILTTPFAVSMLLSPVDFYAILAPREFQKFAERNDSATFTETLKLLKDELG